MKKIFSSLSIFAFSLSSFAQDIPLQDVKKTMSKGEHPAIEVVIPKTNIDEVAKLFESKTKDFKGKFVKPAKGNVEYLVDDAKIANISDQPVDIFALILPEGENVKLTTFYSVGGLFLVLSMSLSMQ
jgi:hypothetical protein